MVNKFQNETQSPDAIKEKTYRFDTQEQKISAEQNIKVKRITNRLKRTQKLSHRRLTNQ